MLTVPEAQARLLDAIAPLPSVVVPLHDALGWTLAERVVADGDFPPTDRSAMDGFAVRTVDCRSAGVSLKLAGEVRAGQDPAGIRVGAGESVRILTGAVIPDGADAVVMVERTEEDRAAGTVLVKERPEPGQNIRRRGEDRRAGDALREPGTVVRAAEVAALAAVGRTRVTVVRPPQAAVISTGDEVVDASVVPRPHQIRDSNAKMLAAQLQEQHVDARDLGIAGDEPEALRARIADGLTADLLLLSGGVSVGTYDLVRGALIDAGCEVLFHNVSMRPGKPLLAAKRAGCIVFGLPGNPVSAFTCFRLFVVPALRKLMGHPVPVAAPIRATLDTDLPRRPGRQTYHLAWWRWRDGSPTVSPVSSASSGDVLALVRANAFIVAPGSEEPLTTGVSVDVLPWD